MVTLAVLTAVAAAFGPVARVLLVQEARRLAAEAARQEHRHQADDPNQDDPSDEDAVVVILPDCEWDRAAKSPASLVALRIAAPAAALAAVSHHPPRFEVARQFPSCSAILAANGTLLNHAPHAPPQADDAGAAVSLA